MKDLQAYLIISILFIKAQKKIQQLMIGPYGAILRRSRKTLLLPQLIHFVTIENITPQ